MGVVKPLLRGVQGGHAGIYPVRQTVKAEAWKFDGRSGALAPVVKGSPPQFAAG